MQKFKPKVSKGAIVGANTGQSRTTAPTKTRNSRFGPELPPVLKSNSSNFGSTSGQWSSTYKHSLVQASSPMCHTSIGSLSQHDIDSDIIMFSQIAEITNFLYLSSAAAVRLERIRPLGITHIINVTIEIPNLQVQNLETTQVRVDDTPLANLASYFDRCADKIFLVGQKGGKTLVHCVAGVSRSATICLAYLMKYQSMTLEQAHAHVKKRRPVIRPNIGFWKQLIDYEKRLYGRNTVKIVNSPIGPIPDLYQEETKNMVWFSTSPVPITRRN